MAFAGKRRIAASEVDGLEPGEQQALSAYISVAPLTARTREALLASRKPTWRQTARHSPSAVPIRTCGQPRCHSYPLKTARSPIFSPIDREQITVAAFLNMFVSWESFLEIVITNLMAGVPTISGATPAKYVPPNSVDHARQMLVGTLSYFDYANHQKLRQIASIYFDRGVPLEPHLGSMYSELDDLRDYEKLICTHVLYYAN